MIARLRRMASLALVVAAVSAGCVVDRWQEPLPGREERVTLRAGVEFTQAPWPVSFRRSAIYEVTNATGVSIETLFLEFVGPDNLREIARVEVLDPAGAPAVILPAPHGILPKRARFGTAGTVLLSPDGVLRFRVDIMGTPGDNVAEFTVPGVTSR